MEEVLQQRGSDPGWPPYARRDGAPEVVRRGRQRGSVYVLDHKVPIPVPRVRDRRLGVEALWRAIGGCSSPGRRMRRCCGSAAGTTGPPRR